MARTHLELAQCIRGLLARLQVELAPGHPGATDECAARPFAHLLCRGRRARLLAAPTGVVIRSSIARDDARGVRLGLGHDECPAWTDDAGRGLHERA